MKKLHCFLVLFSALSHIMFSQQKKESSFNEIRKNYETKTIDDSSAMPYVRLYIQKAKIDHNIQKLLQGYRDGRQFDQPNKIKYADSAIALSLRYGTNDDISKDYLSKGIIYYFYNRKYKPALDEYLKAYQYSKISKDQYQHHKVIYHMGVVKEHLGYYDEALKHFEQCAAFYSAELKYHLHDNDLFNYKKAYLNSIHQLTVVNRYLNHYAVSDSLSSLGYQLTLDDNDFLLEKSYFLKCMGISKFHQKKYTEATQDLESALPMIIERNDFAWASVIYYYLGKISEAQSNVDRTLFYYTKIDTIFITHEFILPEVYRSYNYLIEYYKNKDITKQLYYTDQLLKADSLISKDYPYLSSKLHRDYDRKTLIDQKDNMERSNTRKMRFAKILIFSGTLVLGFFVVRYAKDQKIKKQYEILQRKIHEGSYNNKDITQSLPDEPALRKTSLTPEMTLEIMEKLEKFEKEKQFLKRGLTEKNISEKLSTNSNYLSIYINEHKGMNFNRYIAELRIRYITHQLNNNTTYLRYTIEALAKECGIASRQNFSRLFFDINGIRPTDYIKKRKQELGIS